MSDPKVIEKAREALLPYVSYYDDGFPAEAARAVLDAVADDLRDHCHVELLARVETLESQAGSLQRLCEGLEARAERAEAERLIMERDRNHAKQRAEKAGALALENGKEICRQQARADKAEAALARVLADVEALADDYVRQAQRREELGWTDGKVRDLRTFADDLRAVLAKHRTGAGEGGAG